MNNVSTGYRSFGSVDKLIFITVVVSRPPGWVEQLCCEAERAGEGGRK